MSASYSVFVRTDKSVWEFKSFLESILNCSLEKYPNFNDESFHTSLLGISLYLQAVENADSNRLVQYNDEVFLLSAYDLEIKVYYEPHAFIRYYADEWKQSVSIKIADILTLSCKCECIVVKDFNTVIDRFMPFEERIDSRNINE